MRKCPSPQFPVPNTLFFAKYNNAGDEVSLGEYMYPLTNNARPSLFSDLIDKVAISAVDRAKIVDGITFSQ